MTGAGTPASPFSFSLGASCLIPIVCTTATHPASPANGQTIYETDSKQFKIWDGTQWRVTSKGFFTRYRNEGGAFTPAQTIGGATIISQTVSPPDFDYYVLASCRVAITGGVHLDSWHLTLEENGPPLVSVDSDTRPIIFPNYIGSTSQTNLYCQGVRAYNAGDQAHMAAFLSAGFAVTGVSVAANPGTNWLEMLVIPQ